MSTSRRVLFALPVLFIAASLAAQQFPAPCSPALNGAMSAPCAAAAPTPSPAMPASPTPFYGLGGRRRVEDRELRPHLVSHRRRSITGIPIGSIGAIAVAPSDPNIVYVGTGEPDIRSQHSYGIGMFKSTDAGKTWTTSASKTRARSAASSSTPPIPTASM